MLARVPLASGFLSGKYKPGHKFPANDVREVLMKVKQERKGYGLSGVFLGEPQDSPCHYFGVPCRAAGDEGALNDAIDWGLNLKGPSIIEVFIDVTPYSQTVFD